MSYAWYTKTMWPLEVLALGRLRSKHLAKTTGKTLEIACGPGVNFQYYPTNITDIIAIDSDQTMLAEAYRTQKLIGRPIDIQKMDAHQLIFPNQTFDTVVSTLALCTVTNPVATLQEARRVLKPNGQILLIEHSTSSLPIIAFAQNLRKQHKLKKYGCHSDRDHIRALEEAGFQDIKFTRKLFGIIYLIQARI